jgi:hypothetical protein
MTVSEQGQQANSNRVPLHMVRDWTIRQRNLGHFEDR